MYLHDRMENSAQRWQRFCRPGWRLAGSSLALWVSLWLILVRVVPAPVSAPRLAPPTTGWLPATAPASGTYQTLWTPAAFALPTPAGFTHELRRPHTHTAPPTTPAEPVLATLQPTPRPTDRPTPWALSDSPPAISQEPLYGIGEVFPPRTLPPEIARMEFSEGWESRLFAGIDLNYSTWTQSAWNARVETQFDAVGVPISVVLVASTGQPELDARLVRSVYGWRLLVADASRNGAVRWIHPAVPAEAPPGKTAREAP